MFADFQWNTHSLDGLPPLFTSTFQALPEEQNIDQDMVEPDEDVDEAIEIEVC